MSLQPINSPTTWKRAQTSINANFTALVNALAGEGTVDATDPVVTALLTDNGSGAYAAVEGIVEDVIDPIAPDNDARAVGKGELVYNAADYASLSAAVTALPDGATLYLPAGTHSASALALPNKTITIVGDGPRSTIINLGATGFSFGAAPFVTFRNIGFVGSTAAQVQLTASSQVMAQFIDCRFSGFSQYAVQSNGTAMRFVRCEFDGEGTGKGTAIYADYGPEHIEVIDCTFRYLYRGLYCVDTNAPARNVSARGCTFDGGWMYLKATSSSTTTTFTATTVTAPSGTFSGAATDDTIRAMPVKRSGTLTSAAGGRLNDSGADYISAGVKRGDIVRTSTLWGVVDKVISSTALKVEQWLTISDYQPSVRPANGTAYTVYGLLLGKIVSATSTVATVNRWVDWDGTASTPANGSLVELAPHSDYQFFTVGADKVRVIDNTFRRGWSDQISCQRSFDVTVIGNTIYDGQDVGITIEDAAATGRMRGVNVMGNTISHHGTAGIYLGRAQESRCGSNVILDPNWLSGAASTYGGIQVEDSNSCAIDGNTVAKYNHPNALKAIHISGTSANNSVTDNRTPGFGISLMLTGAGVVATTGRFPDGAVIDLQSGAGAPVGDFSGTGAPTVSAGIGSTYRRRGASTGEAFYIRDANGWLPVTV